MKKLIYILFIAFIVITGVSCAPTQKEILPIQTVESTYNPYATYKQLIGIDGKLYYYCIN